MGWSFSAYKDYLAVWVSREGSSFAACGLSTFRFEPDNFLVLINATYINRDRVSQQWRKNPKIRDGRKWAGKG